ncbi:tyrosinase family protein [Nannocystis punicea]|uniref:Tyrosinase family protein n=1 Tax=Nannocystis punicea TaxID=2995304 RepID=A0ABY7GXC8_9BACT|nr:tyrosinase family protein [Nannocystis poenicansa]WAS91633.1 tyrosinase family protein [Nannocystis poenicansa]
MNASVLEHPTWDGQIRALFAEPYWIDPSRRSAVGQGWIDAMSGYLVQLDQYDSVKQWSTQIYNHLHTRSMPLTTDVTQQWPDAALETFRAWVNQGWRRAAGDPLDPAERIARPRERPLNLRIRRDIVDLAPAELDRYRARLDDLGIGRVDPEAPWQKIAYVHTNWCLHYQEAFLFWHRANMLWLESQIGMPVPYWNWMSPRAAVDGDPHAGLPRCFLDKTYVHPDTGEVRPNPLRFAVARDGRSKACVDDLAPDPACRFVHRDPVLATTGERDREARQNKLDQLLVYQDQVRAAFAMEAFSVPQGTPGYPWANIQTFPAPDDQYPYRTENFDGAYEQPHDNLHGWVGPDMADNAYTAFDPVFWSHHAMIDLVFELWLRRRPATTLTANCPLLPFVGPRAAAIDETDPRQFLYTTVGEMARDSRALGYDFAGIEAIEAQLARPADDGPRLYAVFEGVRCTLDSYTLDLFLDQPGATLADARSTNPHFAIRMTRVGMGLPDDKGRCIKEPVTRAVDLTRTARALGLRPDIPVQLTALVRDVRTGLLLDPRAVADLPGLTPRLAWKTAPGAVPAPAPAPAPPQAVHACCASSEP